MSLEEYFRRINRKIKQIGFLLVLDKIQFERVSHQAGIVRGRLMFINGDIVDFMEFISTREHDYRFAWMDKEGYIKARWDNAPHYPKLQNFPYHVHKNNKVEPSEDKNILDIIEEIKKEVSKELNR